jgi:hypothetical protein
VCRSAVQARQAEQHARTVLAQAGLQLSPEKTRIVELTKSKQGFDFLGFHLRKVESWKWRAKWYLQRWPSAGAIKRIRARIRQLTDRRYAGIQLEIVVNRLNLVLRGWGNYFRHGNSARKFAQIDSYVHERLAILASTKHGRSGRNWTTTYNGEWRSRLGIYALDGTVRYGTAHAPR